MASCQLELHSKCHLQQEHWSDPWTVIGAQTPARHLIGQQGFDYERAGLLGSLWAYK